MACAFEPVDQYRQSGATLPPPRSHAATDNKTTYQTFGGGTPEELRGCHFVCYVGFATCLTGTCGFLNNFLF